MSDSRDSPTPVIPLEPADKRLPVAVPLDPTVASQFGQSAARYNDMSSQNAIYQMQNYAINQQAMWAKVVGGMSDSNHSRFLSHIQAIKELSG